MLKIGLIVIVLLVALRVALPYIILRYANNTLATMPGYRGHVKDIDLAIIRGAYKIDSIYLNKYDSVKHQQTPFFGAKEIDLSKVASLLAEAHVKSEIEKIEIHYNKANTKVLSEPAGAVFTEL